VILEKVTNAFTRMISAVPFSATSSQMTQFLKTREQTIVKTFKHKYMDLSSKELDRQV